MNTAGQEIFYTDNARGINFRGSAVLDGVCAPNSIECTNGATFGYGITAGTAMSINATGFATACNAVVGNHLSVGGNLTVSGFYPVKPYVSLYVSSNAISTANACGYLAPSSFTLTHTTGGVYTFTFTPAHPNGNNFQIFVTPRTTSVSTIFYVCTAKVETDSTAGTKFSVWCRNASNTIVDGDFSFTPCPKQ